MNYFEHQPSDFRDGERRMHRLPAVYVLATPDFEFIKIGTSNDLKQRLSNIRTACPFELSLWQTIRTPLSAAVERHLHAMMKHCRKRGEWFSPSDKDLARLLDFCARTNSHVRAVISGSGHVHQN